MNSECRKGSYYRSRIADSLLAEKLEAKGAVVIRGPKWCGKTTTGEQFANSVIYMDQPSMRDNFQQLAKIDPTLLLEGPTPRLIDEWQLAPTIWDAVRFEVDHRRKRGQFILTGSAVPVDRKKEDIRHTGAGRFAIIEMLPMSLYESGDSNGNVSLRQLFDNEDVRGVCTQTLNDVAFLTCRGGWPFAVAEDLSEKAALSQARDYLDIVAEEDISRVDGVERNVERARMILRSYARFQGTQTPISKIRQDIAANENDSITDDTIGSYLNALRQIYVVKDLDAWNPNIKSKAAIRATPTRYFTDPSIAAAALRAGPMDLINDLKSFGLIFETLCIRDLRVYASAIDGDVYHYRDSNGLECDAVVHLRNGSYGLIEIKLGGERLIDEGVKNLLKLKNLIDVEKMGQPSFMMILTAAGQYAYRREDGVCIVPIGCLKD